MGCVDRPHPPTDWPHFLSKSADVPSEFVSQISSVLLLERLREVNALLGFTRVGARGNNKPRRASTYGRSLCRSARVGSGWSSTWEGIFIRFSEEALTEWEKLDSVIARNQRLLAGHVGWRNSRKLDPNEGYPGPRYVLLHTIAHLLIRELLWNAGIMQPVSVKGLCRYRRRGPSGGNSDLYRCCGLDGTLGGLVDLGKPENLGSLTKASFVSGKYLFVRPTMFRT